MRVAKLIQVAEARFTPWHRRAKSEDAMMAFDESEYLQKRAAAELECAQNALHPSAVRAHYELLGYYLNRLYSEQPGRLSRADKG